MGNIFDQYGMDYTASCNNALRAATIRPDRNVTLPEGKYQCRVFKPVLSPSKKYADELQMRLGFMVIDGGFKGVMANKYYAIIPDQMEILKNDLHVLGVDIGDEIRLLGEDSTLEKIDGLIVDITVKHRQRKESEGHFVNIYINRLITQDESEEAEEDDDDNPFE